MEKRSRVMRYQRCYCEKNRVIQIGSDGIMIFWAITITGAILIAILAAISSGPLLSKFVIPVVLCLVLWISYAMGFSACEDNMLSWGHSKECSKKIARMACMRQALGGGFKEMEESNNETSTK